MKLLIINNLASGYREGSIYDFIRAFAKDGDEIVLRSTDGTTDLREMMQDATEYDAVVASGGDGTIATASYLLAGTGVPLLPFPAGTANLLCLNLHAPQEPHALAKLLREMKTLDFDTAEIEINGEPRGFNLMAGAGYDAVIMKNAAPNKELLGPIAYFTAALTNIKPTTAHFTINVDGQQIERDGLCVLLMNFSKIQFDVPIAHDSDPRDGLLEVAIMKTEDALGLLPAAAAMFMDRDGSNPDRTDAIEIIKGREISFTADPPLGIQYDGEPVEFTTPLRARCLHRAVRYIVSDECLKEYQ